MPSWLPSIPYTLPQEPGYWHPVTSTLNWCEEDYYLSPYVAEVCNTFTNLLFLWLAVKGIRNCLKFKHDTIFLAAFFGYAVVGTGSFMFHATLKYPLQLVDELSMIYTTCFMVFASFGHGRSWALKTILAIGLVLLATFITLYYHYLQDPTFHQSAYAILTIIVLLRSMFVMELSLRPSLRGTRESSRSGTSKAEQARRDLRDRNILIRMWKLVAFGITVFLAGYGLWSVDNLYCGSLRRWRHDVGLPYGILAEGHGWWHLMTGIGAYCYITWAVWLRHCLNGKQDEYDLVWPSLFTMPEVKPVATKPPKTQSNGHSKKSR